MVAVPKVLSADANQRPNDRIMTQLERLFGRNDMTTVRAVHGKLPCYQYLFVLEIRGLLIMLLTPPGRYKKIAQFTYQDVADLSNNDYCHTHAS